MTISSNPYRGFRFPREVIEHAVWLGLELINAGPLPDGLVLA
jgi:hypothetical protein